MQDLRNHAFRSIGKCVRFIATGAMIFLVQGCTNSADTPTQAYERVQQAALSGDVGEFRINTSDATITYLKDKGAKTDSEIDNCLQFMLDRIAAEGSRKIISVNKSGKTAIVMLRATAGKESGNHETGTLAFVNESNRWKLDLRDAFQSWEELAKLATEAEEAMKRATPKLHPSANDLWLNNPHPLRSVPDFFHSAR